MHGCLNRGLVQKKQLAVPLAYLPWTYTDQELLDLSVDLSTRSTLHTQAPAGVYGMVEEISQMLRSQSPRISTVMNLGGSWENLQSGLIRPLEAASRLQTQGPRADVFRFRMWRRSIRRPDSFWVSQNRTVKKARWLVTGFARSVLRLRPAARQARV